MKVFKDIQESRPTHLLDLIGDIKKLSTIDKVIDTHYLSDGVVALIKTKDGNAYEFIIKPAEYSQYFKQYTGK